MPFNRRIKCSPELARGIKAFCRKRIEEGTVTFLGDIADFVGVSPRTIQQWAVVNDYMREILQYNKEINAAFVARGALSRKFDGNFAKFLMSACYGYHASEDVRVGNTKDAEGRTEELAVTVKVVGAVPTPKADVGAPGAAVIGPGTDGGTDGGADGA